MIGGDHYLVSLNKLTILWSLCIIIIYLKVFHIFVINQESEILFLKNSWFDSSESIFQNKFNINLKLFLLKCYFSTFYKAMIIIRVFFKSCDFYTRRSKTIYLFNWFLHPRISASLYSRPFQNFWAKEPNKRKNWSESQDLILLKEYFK